MLDNPEPVFVSILEAARLTSESTWTVKQLLRSGVYRARKAGSRTLIEYSTIKARAESLPAATFAAPRKRRRRA
jgi:hypothetical protein